MPALLATTCDALKGSCHGSGITIGGTETYQPNSYNCNFSHLKELADSCGHSAMSDTGSSADTAGSTAFDTDASQGGGRTTVMLRNLACRFLQEEVADFLDKAGLAGTYRAVHVPSGYLHGKRTNKGYAFVDFKHPHYVDECRKLLHGKALGGNQKTETAKLVEVCMAHQQGVDAFPKIVTKETSGKKKSGTSKTIEQQPSCLEPTHLRQVRPPPPQEAPPPPPQYYYKQPYSLKEHYLQQQHWQDPVSVGIPVPMQKIGSEDLTELFCDPGPQSIQLFRLSV